MQTFHILNGDCLAEQFKQTYINQNYIVCRECLIDGNVFAENLTDFWKVRAKFISETYNTTLKDYYTKTVSEFEKIANIPDNSEVCLWFENDLFCQTNMWFIISILTLNSTIKIFRIFPTIKNNKNAWKGFATYNKEKLEQIYSSRVLFKPMDIELGKNLWYAYQNADFKNLKEFSKIKSECFQYLEEVCQAHIDRFPVDKTLGRPDKVVKELIDQNIKEFDEIFKLFSEKEGIYGFGDLQLSIIYEKQTHQYKQ